MLQAPNFCLLNPLSRGTTANTGAEGHNRRSIMRNKEEELKKTMNLIRSTVQDKIVNNNTTNKVYV